MSADINEPLVEGLDSFSDVVNDEHGPMSTSVDPSVTSLSEGISIEPVAPAKLNKKTVASVSAAVAPTSTTLLSSFSTAQSILASSPELASIFPSLIIALSTAIQQLLPASQESKRALSIADLHHKVISSLVSQTQSLTLKQLAECPPYVHLSPKDCASQLYLDPNTRLSVYGSYSFGTTTGSNTTTMLNMIQGKVHNTLGGGGYRTVRANAGVSSGNWYFETLILNHPLLSTTPTGKGKIRDFVQSTIPYHVRMGDKLKQDMVQGLIQEEFERLNHILEMKTKEELQGKKPEAGDTLETDSTKVAKKRKTTTHGNNTESLSPPFRGGHVRIGWSMRSGELQAPVGYDQYSYAYRDIMGSRIHNSKREDYWFGRDGEASFGPGDVVGFAICFEGSPTNNTTVGNGMDHSKTNTSSMNKTNHIRFFKNGEPMGVLINSKGTRSGGEAFDNILSGTYYPAISAYMGGCCRANFGPYFIYPIKSGCLPTGMKLSPMSQATSASPQPPHVDKAMEKLFKEKGIFGKKVDENFLSVLKEAAKVEASLRYQCYQDHLKKHLEEVRAARTQRNLSVTDLPQDYENAAQVKA